MGIETHFSFAHEVTTAESTFRKLEHVDLLGLLRPFVGPKPSDPKKDAKRKWVGKGFNMIWRPNFEAAFGPKDFFLELNFTDEVLEFTEITGTGIANRSLFEKTVLLGAAAYTQAIKDSFDHTGQHFEPGVWANVHEIKNPAEPASVVRMGSIPHGTTINLQGHAFTAPAPKFATASITPFQIGSPDDGVTGLQHFDEEDLTKPSTSRTDLSHVVGLKPDHLKDPNKFLSDAIIGQNIVETAVLILSSDAPDATIPPPSPDIGGGMANIAFLTGKGTPPTGGPNAAAPKVTTIFWIEKIDEGGGHIRHQIQYTQRVLLNFSGLTWPHITVATLHHV